MTRPLSGGQLGSSGGPLPLGGDISGTTDNARVATVGLEHVATTWDDFVATPAVSSVGGVHTVTGRLLGSGVWTAPVGDSIIYSETGYIASTSHEGLTIVGNFDGDFIFGPVVMSNVDVHNLSVGANSFCIGVTTLLGRNVVIDLVGTAGIRSIRATNVLGLAVTRSSGPISVTSRVGYRVSNTVAALIIQGGGAAVGPDNDVMIEIDSSADIVVFVQVTSIIALMQGVGHVFSVSSDATFGPGANLQITGGGNTGPQDVFFKTGAGLRGPGDIRFLVKGVASAPNWSASAGVGRLDLVNPVSVVLPATPSDPVTVPYSTGAGLEIEPTGLVRFDMFKDPADVNRWWVEYLGPIPSHPAAASWSLFFELSSGPNANMTAMVLKNSSIDVASCQQDDGGAFTDFTAAAIDAVPDDVPLTPSPLAIDDAIYFGATAEFETVRVEMSQSGVGTFTVAFEYFNGAIWTAATGLADRTLGFTAAPGSYDIDHTPEGDWTATTVNGVLAFYLRARVTVDTSLTTQPRATSVATYAGFVIVDSTIGGLEARTERQPASKAGVSNINPRDRFKDAIQNLSAGQTILVYDNTLRVDLIS